MASSNDILYLHTIYFVNNFTVRRLVLVSVVACCFLFLSLCLVRSVRSLLIASTNWMCLTFHDTFGWCWTETHDCIADYFAVCNGFRTRKTAICCFAHRTIFRSIFVRMYSMRYSMHENTNNGQNEWNGQPNKRTNAKRKGNPSKNKLDLFRMRSLLMLSHCSNFFFYFSVCCCFSSFLIFLFYW